MGLIADLTEARGRLDAKRSELSVIFKEAGPDIDLSLVKNRGSKDDVLKSIRDLHSEIDDLGRTVETLSTAQKAADDAKRAELDGGDPGKKGYRHHGDDDDPEAAERKREDSKSWGQKFAESKAGGELKGQEVVLKGDIKTLMTTSAGWAPETTRTGRVVDFAVRPLQVIDLIPSGRTSQAAVVYMEETTFTNNAAETSEGATYAESALALTQRSSTVQKIATFLPVTDEQLEDVAGIQSYVDNRLTFMVRQRLDSQLLVGNGTAPNLRGILNVAGIQTQARGTDPVPDAIFKAMTNVRVTGRAIPNGIIIHPTNWQNVKLLRTADGVYIWGNPSDTTPDRIWGLNVAQSDAITLNTAVVGDFANYSELVIRRDVVVQVSNSHSTFFIEGKQAIRADMRCAFVVYRPAAFCTVTSLI